MVRLMYDSTSPDDIPRDAEMVAYYVDGRYAWPQAWLDLFPDAVKVSISAIGAKTATVGDVEVGCIWPPTNAVDWVLRARADGYDPTIYVNERNDWGPTRAAFDARGVAQPHWWVANYDGRQTIPAGAVAKQYAHPPMLDNRHYDLSAVADHWPGVDDHGKAGLLMSLSSEEQIEIRDKVRMIFTAIWGPSADAPVVGGGPGTPETIQDSVQRVAKRQQDQIEADRLDDTAIANIESLCNQVVALLGQLQVSGMTQQGFDELFRTSPLTQKLLREGAVFVDNDPPSPPSGG